uniref:Uncharacterized protein n=1 Tax=Anguilla anguilla TaxID=7936 RepID=A0A0E9XYI0_ANGAN
MHSAPPGLLSWLCTLFKSAIQVHSLLSSSVTHHLE